jgi:hypothetical protein
VVEENASLQSGTDLITGKALICRLGDIGWCLFISHTLIIPAVSIVLLSCSGSPGEGHAFTEYIEAGVHVASNSGGPKFDGELFKYEKVLTLTQDQTEPESYVYQGQEYLRAEKGFFLDKDGRFFVNDSGNARIAVFDAEGRFERSIGRRGEGPGEFILNELYELTDGILKIHDHNLHRKTYYRTNGELLEMIHGRGYRHHDPDITVTLSGPSHYDEEGHLWAGAGFNAIDAERDTFGAASTREIKIAYEFDTPGHGKGGKSRPAVPFTARPSARYLSDGSVLLTDGVEPVLWRYRLDGSIRKRIDLGISIDAVTRQDINSFFRDLDAQITAADENTRVYLGWMRNAVIFPEYRTLWSHISVDDSGYMWLEGCEMEFERESKGGGYTYYILSPEGEYLGTTRAPAAGRVMRGHLMGILHDRETGREDYTVWRLVSRHPGFEYQQ